MGVFKNDPHGSGPLVLFDVGATSVGVMLAHVTLEGVQPWWEKRVEYAYQAQDEYERYKKTMLVTLLNAGMAAMSEGVSVAERGTHFQSHGMRVVCILSSPWFFASVGTETVTFPVRQQVTHHAVDELRSALFEHMRMKPEYLSWNGIGGEGELVEQVDQRVVLDGYRVRHVSGYEASEVTLCSYLTVVPQQVITPVREILQRVFANQKLEIYSSTRILARSVQESEGATVSERHVVVEVSGRITNVTYVDQGTIAGVAGLLGGTYDIFRASAPEAKSSMEAQSVTDALAKQAQETGEIPGALSNVLAQWANRTHDAIKTVTQGVTPPKTIFLLVRPSLFALFSDMLAIARAGGTSKEDHKYLVRKLDEVYHFTTEHGLGTHVDTRMYLLSSMVRDVA